MEKFRTDMASAAVDARVRADQKDGQDIGVQGTPTFYLNGRVFEKDPTYNNIKAAIDAALKA